MTVSQVMHVFVSNLLFVFSGKQTLPNTLIAPEF